MAQVPHYILATPSPKATLAMVERVCQLLETQTSTEDLRQAVVTYEHEVDEVVAADDEIAQYVRELERQADDTQRRRTASRSFRQATPWPPSSSSSSASRAACRKRRRRLIKQAARSPDRQSSCGIAPRTSTDPPGSCRPGGCETSKALRLVGESTVSPLSDVITSPPANPAWAAGPPLRTLPDRRSGGLDPPELRHQSSSRHWNCPDCLTALNCPYMP